MSRRIAFFSICGVSSFVLAACGMVTGLSDDYKYNLDAASSSTADGGGTDGSSVTDAAPDTGVDAGRCTAQQISSAETGLNSHGGDKLSSACESCLVATCCTQIAACLQSSPCTSVLECVMQCQDNSSVQGRQVCVDQCKSGNTSGTELVGILNNCAPTCTQQPGGVCRLR
jgi:hypothetical protein